MTAAVDAQVLRHPPLIEVTRGGADLIDRLGYEWRILCEESSSEPFYRPEWVAAFVRAFVPSGRFRLYTARIEGKLAAVLPMEEKHVFFSGLPARKLLGCDDVPLRFDLVRLPGSQGDAACAALWDQLKRDRSWAVLQFPDVPAGGALEQLLQAAADDGFLTGRWECMQTPFVPLSGWDGSEDFFLRQVGPNLRHNVRRRWRRLEARGPVGLRRCESADPELLHRFYEIEASGWKGRRGSAIASDVTRRKFYDELAQAAARNGYFTLYLLESNGETLAGQFGLTYRNRYFALKIGVNQKFLDCGPGHLLTNAVLLDCAKRGLTEYDFIAQNDEWKQKWTRHFRRHAYLYIFCKDLYGRLLYFAKFRANPFVRRMLGRKDKVYA